MKVSKIPPPRIVAGNGAYNYAKYQVNSSCWDIPVRNPIVTEILIFLV